VGGVAFRRLVLEGVGQADEPGFRSGRRLIVAAALGLGLTQSGYVIANAAILTGTTGIKFSEVIGASYFVWGCLSVASALVLAVCDRCLDRSHVSIPDQSRQSMEPPTAPCSLPKSSCSG
jgi:hypothetical protein